VKLGRTIFGKGTRLNCIKSVMSWSILNVMFPKFFTGK
jgi:hypothetical protein